MRTFRTGIGRLNPRMLNGMVKASAAVLANRQQIRNSASTYSEHARATSWILAKITTSSLITGASNRWDYAWEEVELTSTGTQTRSGGLTSTGQGYAWNLCEMNNDGGSASDKLEGPGWNVYDAPSGFDLRAIAGGPVVQLWLVRGPSGVKRWVFSLANVLDGTC